METLSGSQAPKIKNYIYFLWLFSFITKENGHCRGSSDGDEHSQLKLLGRFQCQGREATGQGQDEQGQVGQVADGQRLPGGAHAFTIEREREPGLAEGGT